MCDEWQWSSWWVYCVKIPDAEWKYHVSTICRRIEPSVTRHQPYFRTSPINDKASILNWHIRSVHPSVCISPGVNSSYRLQNIPPKIVFFIPLIEWTCCVRSAWKTYFITSAPFVKVVTLQCFTYHDIILCCVSCTCIINCFVVVCVPLRQKHNLIEWYLCSARQ